MKNLQLIKHLGVILLGLAISFICVKAIGYFNPGVLSQVEQPLIKVIFLISGILLLLIWSNKEVLGEKVDQQERKGWAARAVHYFLSQSTDLVSKYLTLGNIFILACVALIWILFYEKLGSFTWLGWFFPFVIIVSFIIFFENETSRF